MTQTSRSTIELSKNGVFLNKYGESACNACFLANRVKNVTDAKFFKEHVNKVHNEALLMLGGVIGFTDEKVFIKPKN